VAYLHHENQENFVLDLVDDPIISNADAKEVFFTLKFFRSPWTRIISQGVNLDFKARLNISG
jgi:hypothetical protein